MAEPLERLASTIVTRSLRMLVRARVFFMAVYLLTAAIFITVDPFSAVGWGILASSGLLGVFFWMRVTAWQWQWVQLTGDGR